MHILPKPSLNQLLLMVIVIATIAFTALAIMVTKQRPLPGDVALLQIIHRDIPASTNQVFLTATELGNPVGIIAIVIVISGSLAYWHRYRSAITIILSVALATVANLVIKDLFKRTRPTLWESIIHAQNFSFPSGHAMASSALVFTLIYIAWRSSWRWLTIIIGSIFMLMVALSRLFFGVHYPSDILGGWVASAIVVACVIYVMNHFIVQHTERPSQHEN